jgi:hypothetical protein
LADAAKTWSDASVAIFAGWKMSYLPLKRQLIISIPTTYTPDTSGTSYFARWTAIWYVMNTETGAWTKFTNLNSVESVVARDCLYFTDGAGRIYKYGASTSSRDEGDIVTVTCECRQAYSYLGSHDNKLVTVMQPMMSATGTVTMTAEADADFNARTISTFTSYAAATVIQPKLSPQQYGTFIAAHMSCQQTLGGVASWYSTKYVFVPGAPI